MTLKKKNNITTNKEMEDIRNKLWMDTVASTRDCRLREQDTIRKYFLRFVRIIENTISSALIE
jgi:hypothetical protein